MDNPDAGGSGGSSRRQSSLPSSLIPLMYQGPHQQQRDNDSPSASGNVVSRDNPPSSITQLPSIASPITPTQSYSQIGSSPDIQTPERRHSRLSSEVPDTGVREPHRAGPSPIALDSPPATRSGGEPPRFGSQPTPGAQFPPFTFPSVSRLPHIPLRILEENNSESSRTAESSGERSVSRRMATIIPARSIMSTWPQSDQDQCTSGGAEGRDLSDEQIWYDEQQRQRRRPEIRPSTRVPSQERESIITDPPLVPRSPFPLVQHRGVAPPQGPQPETSGSEALFHTPAFFGNPYASDTQSYTPLAPQHFPRFYDLPEIVTLPQGQGPQIFPEPFTATGEQSKSKSHGSEAETSVKSRRRSKKRQVEEGSVQKASAAKARRVEDEIDDDDDDDTPRRRVSRKTEVACDFCRRRKLRCDGVRPTCRTCETRKEPCTYVNHVRRRGPGKAPKGTRKIPKQQRDTDPFTTMMDLSSTSGPFVGRPESVSSDTAPRYSPPMGGTMYLAGLSRSPSQPQLRSARAPHMPSQSPVASTSEREAGPSTGRGRRPRKRSASERDRTKRTRRDPEADETDDTSHDPADDDMSYDGQRSP